MPELPEVETIVRLIRASPVAGQPVTRVDVFWQKSLAYPLSTQVLSESLVGSTMRQVDRRGKFIIMNFHHNYLLIHLRMSGDLRIEPDTHPALLHDRMHVAFGNGYRLAFNDPRKFGRIWLVDDPAVVLGDLGIEPFDPNLTPECLYAILQKSTRRVKSHLLDQHAIAGLGNIYTDEALHLAGIHPDEPASMISQQKAGSLLEAIRQVLTAGISHHGASIDWVYRGGSFQNHFRVYRRTGQPCLACGSRIVRIISGQRSTHFCPECQVLTGSSFGGSK